jgi:hypothetical protein
MKQKRNSLGRFEKISQEDEPIFPIPDSWTRKLIFIVLTILILSPWLMLLVRRNTIGEIQAKVTDLYEDVFACPSCPSINCTCPPVKNCSIAEKIIEMGMEKIGL